MSDQQGFEYRFKKQVELLNRRNGFFSQSKLDEKIKALDEIRKHAIPSDVQYLLTYVFSGNKFIAQKAAETIRILLTDNEVKRIDWLSLYNSLRYCYAVEMRKVFKQMEAFPDEEAVHLFGIASLSHNGYVREKALNYLDDIASVHKLPYLLLRLNDWVVQVREKAQGMIEELLPNLSIDILINNYPLIEWLERTQRVDLDSIYKAISNQICADKNRVQLLEEIANAGFKKRLFCWQILSNEIPNDSDLIEIAIKDPAPEIRQWAARHLPDDCDLLKRIEKLLADKAIRVRYAALKRIPRDNWLTYTNVLMDGIYDDSRPIREYSRFALKSISSTKDFSLLYKDKLVNASKPTVGLIMGLAETGIKEDSGLIKSFLKDSRSKVRAATYLALNKLNAEDMESSYIEGLSDAGKVRKACANILIDHPTSQLDQIYDLFKNGSVGTRKETFRILLSQGGLDALKFILEAILDEHEGISSLGYEYLDRWNVKYATRAWFRFELKTYEEVLKLWEKVQLNFQGDPTGLDQLLKALIKD